MVEWKKLGEICEISAGGDLPKNYIKDNVPSADFQYPIYSNGIGDKSLYGYSDSYKVENASITISARGTIGYHTIRNPKFTPIVRLITLIPKDGMFINLSYLNEALYATKITGTKGGIPQLTVPIVSKIQIPIPSLAEQNRIVGILDTFTESIENIKKQIQLRKKQYEFYRDQLLDLEGKPGVEMKTLGDVGTFIRGSGIQKNDFVEEGYPCIHYGQIHTKYGLSATETISFINENLYKKCKKAKKGDLVIATTSEDAEGVAKPVAWLGDDDVAISGDSYIYHHSQNGKFMAHQLISHPFMLFKVKHATGTKVVRISGDSMSKYLFPLPSLSEQSRIVSILDQFESSIANLEHQLSLRQKQYEYYRNKLLTFE